MKTYLIVPALALALTTLSDEAARAFAQQKGELWLRELTTLSDEAAAVLGQKRDIRLAVQFKGEKNEAANSRKPSHRTYVYAKIILPIKPPAKGEHPAVESWIAKKLRRRGETEFRAVTNWVRLAEGDERDSDIWAATVDGKNWGCPVSGRVSERTADGKVKVELSGWSPVAVAKIKGGTLAAETGSRTIATVDTGIDQDGRAFVALVVGPGKATHDHAKKHSARFHKLYSTPTGDKDGFKHARVAVSINQKSVLSRNYLVSRGEDVRDRIGAYLWSLNPDDPKRIKLPDSTKNVHSLREPFEKKQKLAIQGDAEAQYGVGVMYAGGFGTEQDYAQAMHWCRLASDQGHKHAPCVIGGLFEKNGRGVEQNSAEVEKWYLLSADRGSEEAMRALGDMYLNGKGVDVDHAKAASWFAKAAENLDWRSQVRLAAMYEDGLGVEQNLVQAYAWMFTANHNSGNGKTTELEQIRAKMTAEETEEAQKLGAEFVERYGKT